MFGYVIPDKPNMTIKDFGLYRAHYCGLCKALGRESGQFSRFLTNYDCTFLSLILHNLALKQPEINHEGCVLNEFKKKPIVRQNEILSDVAAVSVLLSYYKAADDAADEGTHRALKTALSAKRKKLARKYPKLDKLIFENYLNLNALETASCDNIDKLADCFAKILEGIVTLLSGKDDAVTRGFSYHLGRWIYFMDAVDDVEKDFKKGVFNPVLAKYAWVGGKTEYLAKYSEEIKYLLFSTYNMIVSNYDNMQVSVGEGPISNIIYKGLPAQMERILKGDEKCQKIRI